MSRSSLSHIPPLVADIPTVNFVELPPERFNGKIPFIVTAIVNELLNRHADEVEGLFRLSGAERDVLSLLSKLGEGPVDPWPETATIHVLTGVLKRYLRKLTERDAFIPLHFSDSIVAAVCVQDDAQVCLLLKNLLEQLSPVRFKMLAYLCRFWHGLTLNSAVNKMAISNLAICVAQVLMIPPTGASSADMQSHIALITRATQFFIGNCNEIFAEASIANRDFCTPEDISIIMAPKLNMANVNHLIVRDAFRRESLIPWKPPCQVENRPSYERPSRAPVPQAARDTLPPRKRLTMALKKMMANAAILTDDNDEALESTVGIQIDTVAQQTEE
jgi:hypothetical protein